MTDNRLHPALHGLVDQLPGWTACYPENAKPPTWTTEQRALFLEAFTKCLDYIVAIDDDQDTP